MTQDKETITVKVSKKAEDKPYGIKIRGVNGQLYVKSISPESPFKGTAIRPGQRILAINGSSCANASPSDAGKLLKADPKNATLTTAHPVAKAVPVATTAATTGRQSPPGVQEGGVWGRGKYFGPKSGGIMTTFCVAGLFVWPACICALIPTCAPCDERELYKVGNKFYDANGKYLGTRETIREFLV